MKNNIRVERVIKRMTQEELARRTGVTRQTINVIEAGKYAPSAVLGTAGIETARLGAGKISEMIVQMATLNADITDYAYYADNEKVSMADLANHHISELASFQVNPQQRRIDLSWRKGDTPSPVRIGKGLFYPMSSVSVRKVLESRFDKKTLSEYALYKDGKPITPEQLDDLPITELENISPNDTSRTIEIQSKQPEHGSIQP